MSTCALLLPLALLRSRKGESRRARIKRVWNSTISLFMLPVMFFGAENIAQAGQRAQEHRAAQAAIAAVAAAQASVIPPSPVGISVEAMAAGMMGPSQPVAIIEYTWDDNGNMLSKAETQVSGTPPSNPPTDTFSYDYQNRLIKVEREIGQNASANYDYDADGIRRSQTVGGQSTRFITDKSFAYAQVIVEVTTDESATPPPTTVTTYVHGDDLISRTTRESGEEPPGLFDGDPSTRYYHYDGQMSTRQLSGYDPVAEEEDVTDEYTYEAFGNLLNAIGGSFNNYLYTGEQYDPNAGFYYLRARYYDQGVGRFATRDGYSGNWFDPATLHKYTYCENGPLGQWDPSGHFTVLDVAVVLVLISILTAMLLPSYNAMSHRQPRVVFIKVHVNPVGKFSNWDNRAIQDEVRRIVNPTSLGLRPGQAVNFMMTESTSPTNLGWEYDHDGLKSIYNCKISFTDLPLQVGNNWIGYTGAANDIKITTRTTDLAENEGTTLDTQFYANVVAHEVFWHAVDPKADESMPGDIRHCLKTQVFADESP